MAQSLGSLYVELSANTAKFVGPLSDAARAAHSAATGISREFSSLQRVASQTFGAFASFNPVISELSFAISEMGNRAAEAMESFGKVSTAAGAIGAIGAGAAAGLASFAVGTLALAAHSTEAAARMYELHEATGLSMEALTGLGFVAKQRGVDMDTFAKDLERMSRSAFAAATAPVGAINAYTRLGVAVKDSAGQMRSTESIFTDLAGKFSDMADGPAKAALMMQVFSRNGADLTHMLDLGAERTQHLLEVSKQLGTTLSNEDGKAADEFKETLGLLGGITDGAANALMHDLLPALNAVATALFEGLQNNSSGLRDLISGAATLAKVFLATGDTIYSVLRQVGILLGDLGAEIFEQLQTTAYVAEDIARGQFKGAYEEAKEGLAGLGTITKQFIADSKADWSDYAKFTANLVKPLSAEPTGEKKNPPIAGPARSLVPVEQKDTVSELVEKLKAQTAAELNLAGAIGLSAAAELAQKAAGEASAKIAETKTELLDRERGLREQLANAQTNQQGTEAARIQAEIAGVQKLLAELGKNVPLIQTLYLELDAAQESVKLGGEMSKEGLGFDREISSLQALAQAYRSGDDAAIAAAGIEKQLAEDRQRVAEQQELLARVKLADPSNSTAIERESAALANLNAALELHRAQLQELASENIGLEIDRQTKSFTGQAAAVAQLNAARLKGAAVVREAEVQVKVSEFRTANPGASPDQIQRITELYRQQSAEAQRTSVSEVAAQYEVNRSYDDEITKLEQAREVLQGVGQSTLLIDAAIDDAQQKNNASLDQAAEKVGTLAQKYAALLDTIQRQGDNLGEMVFGSLEKSLDSLSDELAKFIVTGKNGFKQWGEQLAESLVNDSIKNGFSNLAGLAERASGGNLTGSAGKGPTGPLATVTSTFEKVFGLSPKQEGKGPSGSAADPIYVAFASSALSNLASRPGAPGSSGSSGFLGNIFGKPGTTPPFLSELTPPIFPSDSDSAAALGLPDFGSVLASGPASPNAQPISQLGSLSSIFKLFGNSLGSGLSSVVGGVSGAASSVGSGIASFFSMFAGFLAEGGDVTPGKAYMVGEKHPEFFVPKQAGSVVPTLRTGGGEVHNHNNTININVPPGMNADSFQRSQGQIYADAHAHLAAANARR